MEQKLGLGEEMENEGTWFWECKYYLFMTVFPTLSVVPGTW